MNTSTPEKTVVSPGPSTAQALLVHPLAVSPKSKNKTWQYGAMLTILTTIYFCYFAWDARANACAVDESIG